MTELEDPGVGENTPPYMIFVVVFLFFLTGLLGFLICHLLKKKGYRCRTGDMDDEDEEEEKLGANADDEDEENQDTVEQILKCIIENEANMEAFNEMFGNHNVCVRHDPRLRKESIGGVPPHHHTVHSGTDHNSCHLCAQVRSKKGRRQSRTPRSKQRAGEQTVFSVGRFRVTHTDKKLHGGPHPLVGSGDQLDQSQDSEERKEGGYNLRSMFKDVQPPSDGSNGVAPNVGKRRKSLTIFGLRRGSDPVGIKVGEGTGRETGGVRFAIQQQPVVLEELLQAENVEVAPQCRTKPEINPSKNHMPDSPQNNIKNPGPVNSPSFQSKDRAHGSKSGPEDGSKPGPSPETHTNLLITPSVGTTAASAPSSLPIASTAKQRDAEDKNEELYDPGPLQTSTPIAPMPGSIAEPCSNTGLTQTPPDPSSSADLESGFGASLALISLGSSSASASSLKTPISPMVVTPSPKLSSRYTPSTYSPALTPSPKLPSGRAMSSQSPIPSSSFGLQAQTPPSAPTVSPKLLPQTPSSPADQNPSFGSSTRLTMTSGSVTSVTSVTKGDVISSRLSLKEPEPEGIPNTEEKPMRLGILKTAKPSPVEGYSSTDQLSTVRLSPSSPVEGRISSVTIIKASPDSKREFSVITMVEEKESSMSIKDQKGETSEPRVETEKAGISPAVGEGGEVCVSGVGVSEVNPKVSQEKDDMVQMEDIRDCKVTQVEETEREEENI